MIPEEGEELKQTLREKILFHVTAFFVLVGIFSLFAFLFLVPFVVDPALSTISAAFDPTPADCVTVLVVDLHGNSNCTWSSCREGCTREVYHCTQVRIDYRRRRAPGEILEEEEEEEEDEESYERRKRRELASEDWDEKYYKPKGRRYPRALPQEIQFGNYVNNPHPIFITNDSDQAEDDNATFPQYAFYSGARLFPNVKGCGYPPVLNCSIWYGKHAFIGATYPCHYSRIDPGLVITQLDMHAVYMDLIYAVLIPVPSFIISVVYLAFAYFKIYNEEEPPPEEGGATEGGEEGEECEEGSEADVEGKPDDGTALPVKTPTGSEGGEGGGTKGTTESGIGNGVAGGGSLSGGKSGSPTSGEELRGNLTKTMTTSITPPPGPIAEV